jgi:hypothetical protein
MTGISKALYRPDLFGRRTACKRRFERLSTKKTYQIAYNSIPNLYFTNIFLFDMFLSIVIYRTGRGNIHQDTPL